MRTTKLIKQEVEVEITEDIFCNKCGESLKVNNDPLIFCGLAEMKYSGSYHSHIFSDGDEYTFSLCEKCLKNIFDECKIKPKYYDRINYGL